MGLCGIFVLWIVFWARPVIPAGDTSAFSAGIMTKRPVHKAREFPEQAIPSADWAEAGVSGHAPGTAGPPPGYRSTLLCRRTSSAPATSHARFRLDSSGAPAGARACRGAAPAGRRRRWSAARLGPRLAAADRSTAAATGRARAGEAARHRRSRNCVKGKAELSYASTGGTAATQTIGTGAEAVFRPERGASSRASTSLSSTPKRCGLYAKINRNGTFSTGMKNRISAPVEVLNALVWPIFSQVRLPARSDRPAASS